jgi:PAS domain S-box-containing protein
MADTASMLVWMSGVDKRCTYFNKRWLDFTGRPLQHELGDGWSEGVHPNDLQRCWDTYAEAFDARQEFRMEYRLRRFDGEYRWLLDAGAPRFDEDGEFEGYIGSCIDITDQKRDEEALREGEARLRSLLESTHAVPWVADAQSWRFTYVGRQASELFGYPAGAWYSEGFWANHIHADDREAAVALCLDKSRRETDYEFDYRMVAADGRTLWIHDIVHVDFENGAPKVLSGYMIDVTARRHAEDELRIVQDQLIRVGRAMIMGELVASIAHEVNQPLCAIMSNAQTIQRLLDRPNSDMGEVREALQDIILDGRRASEVISRIYGSFRNAPVQRVPVNINDLIRDVAALLRSEMRRRGAVVGLELVENLPQVLGDGIQLQQVVLNVMANGADAMDRVARDQREMIVRTTTDENGGVVVAVTDAGVGIDPQKMDQIFSAFFTTKPGSMGMGLAICKSIIEGHGGAISARPNGNCGTTVQFTLPGISEGAS